MMKNGFLIRRQYLDVLKAASGDNTQVKTITGMRGVGKTTLMDQFIEWELSKTKTRVLNYDFDDVTFFDMRTTTEIRNRILKECDGEGNTAIILHEVQKIVGWDTMITELVGMNVGEFFLTSSDDTVLNLRKFEAMKDKVVDIRMTPMSLNEFMEMNNFRSAKNALPAYLSIGGLPGVRADMPNDLAMSILAGIFNTAILKDVLTYDKSLNPDAACAMANLVMMESGSSMSSGDVSGSVGTSFRKSSQILGAMAGCFLIFENEGRSLLSKLTRSDMVYYAADIGLRNSVKGYRSEKISLAENALLIELKRLGYSVKIGGNGATRVFTAADAEGTVDYSICAGQPPANTSKKITVSIDEDSGFTGYTLSRFLSEEVD